MEKQIMAKKFIYLLFFGLVTASCVSFYPKVKKKIRKLQKNSTTAIFKSIYDEKKWGDGESVSGAGSDLIQTSKIRVEIPNLLKSLKIQTLIDAPCGDYYWMKEIDLPIKKYYGIDIVKKLIYKNREEYQDRHHIFKILDFTKKIPPKGDLILCRDCFIHLSHGDIHKAIQNFKASGSKYLLTTTYPSIFENSDIKTGDWRLINLEKPPFNFPPPIKLINEGCTEGAFFEGFDNKALGLWKLEDL